MAKFLAGDVRKNAPSLCFVKIRKEASGSCVPVSMTPSVETALSIALNLHQLSSMQHHITVENGDGVVVATLIRVDSVEFKLSPQSK